MKKLILLMVVMLTVALTGCKKDDVETGIEGKWNVTEFNSSGTWETVKRGDMYAIFNSDGTYNSKFISSNYSGTWSKSGETITCNVSGVYITYKILSQNGNSGTFEVKEPGYKPYNVKAVRE